MNNPYTTIGSINLGQLVIDIVKPEPCYRVGQYMKGEAVTCKCTICKAKNQTPEEAKKAMDKVHNK